MCNLHVDGKWLRSQYGQAVNFCIEYLVLNIEYNLCAFFNRLESLCYRNYENATPSIRGANCIGLSSTIIVYRLLFSWVKLYVDIGV